MDGQNDGWLEGWMMDGWMDGCVEGWMNDGSPLVTVCELHVHAVLAGEGVCAQKCV